MKGLFENSRFYILTASVTFSFLVVGFISFTIPSEQLQIIRLNQIYGFASLVPLYIALLAGPFCYTFSGFPLKNHYLHGRRAIGVSAFYFGLLHTLLAFFGQLGGFAGLGFLSNTYLVALSAGMIALTILSALAMTSFDAVIEKMTFKRWKILQRFVYLAGVLILVHTLMLGTHYHDLASVIPQLTFFALVFLLFLEAMRFDAFLQRKFTGLPQFGITSALVMGASLVFFLLPFFPSGTISSIGIHSQHSIENKQEADTNSIHSKMLQGDASLRFTVDIEKPEVIVPGQDATFRFTVYNANSGNRVEYFKIAYEKLMHLIIVDEELEYYNHIHPQFSDGTFTITTQFSEEGRYHLYLDFQPVGAREQQFGFTVNVGRDIALDVGYRDRHTDRSKTFGDYHVELSYPQPLLAAELSEGRQKLTFTITDKEDQPVKTLKPYLGAFGHMVMINQETYDFLHVHPTKIAPREPNATGGPAVAFSPMPLYGEIKPGYYKVFAQFNPDGKLFTADFVVEVE